MVIPAKIAFMQGQKPLVGFIGQGYVGKNYGDDFETRGFSVVRYSLEEPYIKNKDRIKDCDIVFIAVWTPTTPTGFDLSIIESVLPLVGDGKIAVIKSTILPGTTKRLQTMFPKITLMYSPEFLSVATAAQDASHPFSNIVGIPVGDVAHKSAAEVVMNILPQAPFTKVCNSSEAELIKYSHNMSGYVQIILFNMLYDAAKAAGADWAPIQEALSADPYICNRYAQPVHKSGRGAGGGCFIKDFAAFRELYQKTFPEDTRSLNVLHAIECKNVDLLVKSNKDLDLLRGVYGEHPESVCGS